MRLSQPDISDLEIAAIDRVMRSEYLGMGPEVSHFENELSEFLGKPVVCVNTGTSALQLALLSSNIGKGDEVLVPSLTYVATFQAISATGAKPVACDIKLNDLQIDVKDAESRITNFTKAVVPVYYAGAKNCELRVAEFAKKFNLINIPDAAHSFGSKNQEISEELIPKAEIYSLDGIKNITSGEGGIVASNDQALLERVRDIRTLGVIGDTTNRFKNKRSWDFEVNEQGWRYHMSDIFACIGRVQLTRFEELAQKRRMLYKNYKLLIGLNPNIALFDWEMLNIGVPHIFVIRIPGMRNRELLREKLQSDGIPTGVHYKPNHRLKYFAEENTKKLINTDLVFPEILTLPLHPKLTFENQTEIVNSLLRNLKFAYE